MRRAAPAVLAGCLLILPACRRSPLADAWDRVDLWRVPPQVESTPAEWRTATLRQINFLGSFGPRTTAGQIKALEQRASSRVRWTIQPGRDAYVSFVPLGTTNGCACVYRLGVREESGRIRELYKGDAQPVSTFAPAAVEVDLSAWAGRRIDLLAQIDGSAAHPPDQPVPSVLWGSPAVYSRKELAAGPQPGHPNILLIGFDTLRADALGSWGRNPTLTPALDQLAAQSDVWLSAYSTFNATNPSFASILTGLYGKHHGVYDLRTPLPPGYTTLAERLAGAGYDTLAFISAHHLGDQSSGLGQGFAQVSTASEHYAAEMPVDMAMDWLADRSAGTKQERPFFIWLHLFDPHTPHTPPLPYALGFRPAAALGLSPVRAWAPFRRTGARGFAEPILGGDRDLYDGEVAYLDRQVGRLLDFLESRGLLAGTLVAVVADHGENLGEHGIRFRHAGLFDTTTHVPLMIRWPGATRPGRSIRRIQGLVQTIDLFPTLLAAAGLAVPQQDGVDLRALSRPGGSGRRAVFSEHASRMGVSVRTREYRYGLSQGNPFFPDGPYLFDSRADPGETRNLAGRGLPVEKELNDLLLRWLSDRRRGPPTRELNDEEAKRLKALGYG